MKKPAATSDKTPLIAPALSGRWREIGAIAESSRHLAKRMVTGIDFSKPGLVVELGPGRGAMTRVIAKKATDPSRILLLEVVADFLPALMHRFPKFHIHHDSAEHLAHHVGKRRVNAIVSGLPLRALPKKVVKAIGKALDKVMDEQSLYIQFTYDLRPGRKAFLPQPKLRNVKSTIVWRNLPPARVDFFKRKR